MTCITPIACPLHIHSPPFPVRCRHHVRQCPLHGGNQNEPRQNCSYHHGQLSRGRPLHHQRRRAALVVLLTVVHTVAINAAGRFGDADGLLLLVRRQASISGSLTLGNQRLAACRLFLRVVGTPIKLLQQLPAPADRPRADAWECQAEGCDDLQFWTWSLPSFLVARTRSISGS